LIFQLTVAACAASGIVSVITFVLYVRARLDYREEAERIYQSIHFITLALFVLLGVLLLVQLSNRLNTGRML
jgi:cytochrome bd-type quinol oxidase subunit 2